MGCATSSTMSGESLTPNAADRASQPNNNPTGATEKQTTITNGPSDVAALAGALSNLNVADKPAGAPPAAVHDDSSSSSDSDTECLMCGLVPGEPSRSTPRRAASPAQPRPGDAQVGLLYDSCMELHDGPGKQGPG